ncbi:MAG: response regulator [Actinomycetota bacterium]
MTGILFVDDEELVLQGLRTALRPERKRWDMVFASSGEEAARSLEEHHFDVVVTEARMPGMDGVQLLSIVKERQPGAARLVLSGDTDEAANRRFLNLAHQFLAKPARPEVVREALDRTCRLRALLADERLVALVGDTDTLPVPPALLARLDAALADPDASLRDVAEIVEGDPAMCAKVLQVVNSAFFGLPRHVGRLAEAISYLGLAALRHLVLSVAVVGGWSCRSPAAARVVADVRARGLPTGALARTIATELGVAGRDEAFLAGVVHDAGILMLASRMEDRYAAIAASADAAGEPLHQAEARELGVTHGAAGAYLLGLWGLPTPVVEAIAHHHDPAGLDPDRFDLAAVLHVAEALVAERTGSGDRCRLDTDHLQRHGMADRVGAWRAGLDAGLAA